jgi:hypothetical protein
MPTRRIVSAGSIGTSGLDNCNPSGERPALAAKLTAATLRTKSASLSRISPMPRVDLRLGLFVEVLTEAALSRQLSTSRKGKGKSGFMMLRRHLATAPPLRLGRSAAWTVRRGGVAD